MPWHDVMYACTALYNKSLFDTQLVDVFTDVPPETSQLSRWHTPVLP
jgi:hypothetical protein